ncbi:MAG: hypothetical protein JXB07_03505 [Anaerolineae bacterium]|nr:hypothetical protein [Anaerolineae bacterium]
MVSLCFVGCVKEKQLTPTLAQNLYTSSLFQKSRAYAERYADKWYILSAKYGLLKPDQVVVPYDMTLKTMRISERKKWSEAVLASILEIAGLSDKLIFLTGTRYHEYLVPRLRSRGYQLSLPMEGLSFGRRLQWLNTQIGGSAHD